MESDLLLASPRSLVRVASARLAALAGLALAAVAAASSRSPAASTALLEQLASPTAVPTASPTPRAQRFDAIDDDNASSCYAYETAQYGVAACNATDTAFCESVLRDVLTNGIRATTSSLLTEAHMLRSFEGGGGTRADAKRRHRRHLRSKPGQLTARHLQIGLHLDVDLHAMCDCSPRLGAVILAYLDQETEALLRLRPRR